MGPELDVLPYVNSDGFTIEMSLAPQITEFLGYEESTFEAAVFAAGGNVVRSAVPCPYSYALAECELCGLGPNGPRTWWAHFRKRPNDPGQSAFSGRCAFYWAIVPWQRSQQQKEEHGDLREADDYRSGWPAQESPGPIALLADRFTQSHGDHQSGGSRLNE